MTSVLLIQLLNGLAYSLLLFLLAAGLSLIFGMLNIINLSHGALYMIGAYLGLTIAQVIGNFWVALLLAPLLVGVLGTLIEQVLLRPLYQRDHLDQVLLTLGLAYITGDLVKWIWGADVQSLDAPAGLAGTIALGGAAFPVYRLFVIGLGLALAGLLWFMLARTRVGVIVRAGVTDREMVSGLGINIDLTFRLVFAIGAALAALGGVAAGPILSLFPGMDGDVLVFGLIIVVIGGMGTLGGAFWGSLLVGVVDTFGSVWLPNWSLFTVYALMAAVLLWRPTGLFGQKA